MINSKKKKEKKKRKQTMADDAVNDDDELNSIPTPHVLDLWPFRLSAFIFHTSECMSTCALCGPRHPPKAVYKYGCLPYAQCAWRCGKCL